MTTTPIKNFTLLCIPLILPGFFSCGLIGERKPLDWTADVPGDLGAFQVHETYPAVRDFISKKALLCKLHATGIKPDGSIYLKKRFARLTSKYHVTYFFIRRYGKKRITYRYVELAIGRIPYMPRRSKKRRLVRDMTIIRSRSRRRKCTALKPPRPFASIWKIAIKEGAPRNAIASILYDVRGYKFSIHETVEVQSQNRTRRTREMVFSMQLDRNLKLLRKRMRKK